MPGVLGDLLETIIPKKGIHYFDGIDGRDGERGKDGINGKNGKNGEDGKNGLNGKNGKDGVDGKDGKDGKNTDMIEIKGLVEEIIKDELPENLLTEKELEKILSKRKFSVKNIADLEPRLNNLRTDMRWHGGGMSTGKFISGEVVSGSGTSWALAHSPQLFIGLYSQGQRLSTARGDYTISDSIITTVNSWSAGDLEADYYKQ